MKIGRLEVDSGRSIYWLLPLVFLLFDYCSVNMIIPAYKAGLGFEWGYLRLPEDFWRYLLMRVWFSVLAALITGLATGYLMWKFNASWSVLWGVMLIYAITEVSLVVRDYVHHYAAYYDVLIECAYWILTATTILIVTKILDGKSRLEV